MVSLVLTESNIPSKFFTVSEVAEKLRMGESTIHKKTKSGDIPCYYIGGRKLVSEEDLNSVLRASRVSKVS